MKFAINRIKTDPVIDEFANEVITKLCYLGHEIIPITEKVNYIFNITDVNSPEAVLRKSNAEFVISIACLNNSIPDIKAICYTTLVKTLSNLFIGIYPGNEHKVSHVSCITPEAGFFSFPYDVEKICEVILPIVSSHMFIRNKISADLPASLNNTTLAPEKLKYYGHILDKLGIMPAPFPLRDVLSAENTEHLYNLFRMKGLSYGNLSIREDVPGFHSGAFWMTARGVDKADLKGIGEDILLVTGADPVEKVILVSVPEDHNPKIRVSVDAIEHLLIYHNFPEVGAIVHVHAWMKDIVSTKQVHPCGTIELAEEVVELLGKTDNSSNAVVGLKNHGITMTGHNLEEIFVRIHNNILKEVPMYA